VKPPVIVVPDGVKTAGTPPQPVSEPSFVYRAVLDRVAAAYAEHPIYLAPANQFGIALPEQLSGKAYLTTLGKFDLTVPATPQTDRHIDTRGNARLLREHLESQGHRLPPAVILAVAHRHARRAVLCFRKEGFEIVQVDAVPYDIPPDERIVRRAWYYRYPHLHSIYENLAYIRDWLRP